MTQPRESYYVVIPMTVLKSEDLTPTDKLLYGEISALTRSDGICIATNAHLVRVLGVSERTISTSIKRLEKGNFIKTSFIHEKDGKTGTWRRIEMALPYTSQNLLPRVEKSATQKRVKQENKNSNSYGNPLVSYVISEFRRIFGYKPATRQGGQSDRQIAYNLVRMIGSKIKKDLPEDKRDDIVKKAVTAEMMWIKKQDWSDSVVGLVPLRTHVYKFLTLYKNGKA